MSYPLSAVIVDPQGVSTSVAIADSHGNTASVFSDRFGVNPVSLPAMIVTRTLFYMPGEGPWTFTPTVDGVVLASQTLGVEAAEVATVTVPVVYARSTQLPTKAQLFTGGEAAAANLTASSLFR